MPTVMSASVRDPDCDAILDAVPRISAATVAQHRAKQRDALINAATEILTAEGIGAVTPAAVGARAGLARSSVYQYFPSTAALIATIVEEAFPRANHVIRAALSAEHTPLGRVDGYVRQTLLLAAEGAHRPASALARADLPQPCLVRLRELHAEQAVPLVEALRELGVRQPDLTAQLIGGLLHSAMTAIEQGVSVQTATRTALDLIHHGLSEATAAG
jgi:AcrR family transcriptional regulator